MAGAEARRTSSPIHRSNELISGYYFGGGPPLASATEVLAGFDLSAGVAQAAGGCRVEPGLRPITQPSNLTYIRATTSPNGRSPLSAMEFAMTTSVKQMMEAANAAVPRITPTQAREMMAKGNTLVVDVRDAPEVEKSGKLAGAINV